MAHFIGSRYGMLLSATVVGATTALYLYAHYKSEKTVYECVCAIGRRVLDSIYRDLWRNSFRVTSFFHVEKVEEAQAKICLLFFQVKGNGIPAAQRVYLLGTNHAVKAREYPEWVLEEIQNCDLLVSEFDKELITGDPRTNAWQRTAENLLIIQKKLFDFDEEWFKVHLTKLGYNHEVIESVISMLKEKRDELKRDQTNWQSQLSEEAQMQIQQHLNGYELRLANVDPFFVESSLGYASGAEDTDIDTNTGEIVILQNFQDRNRPIINLESLDGALLMYLEEFLNDISSYSLEGSLEGIQNLLIGNVKEKTSAENYIRLANGKIVCDPAEFKESLKKDDDDDATPALVYRNIQGVPKIISAINQKKDTAITVGAQHLMGSTGLIQSLEQKGYCVEHVVKFCKE